jgi:fructan beta-fructosidase
MRRLLLVSTFVLCATFTGAVQGQETRPDIVAADFEGPDYGGWRATGEAFGSGPARGTLPGQMEVSGFLGRGLVNSFFRGDDTTGTLTSPPFRIERNYLNFLIGGGGYSGETCVNLLVDGKAVRTATGPNVEPGGSERLRWHTWDLRELAGMQGVIEIVDRRTGGWGHINVDQIVQGDRPRQAAPAHREITLDHRYLHLPVRTGAAKRRMSLAVGGRTVREFDIELAEERPDFLAFADLEEFRGKSVRIAVDSAEPGTRMLDTITQADDIPDAAGIYREPHRPQFHFTSRRGWHNDPNGLVWQGGNYHLFYQHNPYGWNWGNMHWGHAVSPDLVHWKELPTALYPPRYGDWCFSGSAVVDARNTAGFQSGNEPPLVVAFTSTGRGECIASSNDRGRTWQEYAGNPVVKHAGRDPKLVWYAPKQHWVMAVYDEAGGKQGIAFHTSKDLKNWTLQSKIDGFFECPDLFELPVDGDETRTRWVLHAADGKYVLGDFDGQAFRPTSGKDKLQVWYGNFYAAQSFSDTPDRRRIQVGWGQGVTFPGMPFNQQMTVPVQLNLRSAEDGPRLFAEPVAELSSLRGRKHEWSDLKVSPGDNPLRGLEGDLFEVSADFSPGDSGTLGLELRGVPLVYDAATQELSCKGVKAPLKPIDGRVRLHVYLDRGSIEAFGNDGLVAMSVGSIPDDRNRSIALIRIGGAIDVHSLVVHELTSAWERP